MFTENELPPSHKTRALEAKLPHKCGAALRARGLPLLPMSFCCWLGVPFVEDVGIISRAGSLAPCKATP